MLPRSSSISAPSIACSSCVGASIAVSAVFVINLGFIHRLQLRCSIKFLYELVIIFRPFLSRATQWKKPLFSLNHQRGIHSRNKKAMEMVAKGWSTLQEVDRVIDYTELNDPRLIPFLCGAKENFELALEIDNLNIHVRYWLGRMHFKYHVPGACKLVGAALLVEAANMGDADAQYELGCHLRVENDYGQSDQQALYYLEKVVDQLHPGHHKRVILEQQSLMDLSPPRC